MNEINQYREAGFTGFVKVSDLRQSSDIIPQAKGVYIVARESDNRPRFVETGSGGHFKGKDPNVPIAELESNVVECSHIMYIGKATDLRKRIGQLLRFGAGANTGHWGGRYLWQLTDADNLIIAWKETPDEEPASVESEMLDEYIAYHGMLPFANLRK